MKWSYLFFAPMIWLFSAVVTLAGMPAPLPTPYTKDAYPHLKTLAPWVDERLQALSFFLAVLLLCAAGVRWLWNLARHDWPQLPPITYRRSLAFTLLWGLAAMVILTMISGARELMTPGAWRKQGWTYKLEAAQPAEPHFRTQRRTGLEQLRIAVLQYAALNHGSYPPSKAGIAAEWAIPAHPGFEFLYRPSVQPSALGEVLIVEPELGDAERFVLLSNGLIGTMQTPQIEAAFQSQEP